MTQDTVAITRAQSDPWREADMAAGRMKVDPGLIERVHRGLDEIRSGRMVILVDDEDRENEGDLTMAAGAVTADAINFMAKYGRGLICLALDNEQIDRLQLPLMAAPGHGTPALGTAFTVSIEARRGVTTGISAADRAHTIRVAADPESRPEDLATPGHVFPLRARSGGVLVRTGQTEGSVDLARLAGLAPAGVICEIMKDDGTMARRPDLEEFAERHGMMILTIADLVEYRLQTERLVERVDGFPLHLDETRTQWMAIAFKAKVQTQQFLALVKGDIATADDPVLCRVHRGSLVADLFSSPASEGGRNLRKAMRRIEQAGRGVVLYLPSQGDIVSELKAAANKGGVDGQGPPRLRDVGLGAQVLSELGLRKIGLLTNNPRKIAGLAGFGLEVTTCVALGD